MERNGWLFPALLVALAAAAAYLWVRKRDADAAAAAAKKAAGQTPACAKDAVAALTTIACEGGAAAIGGTQAGMGAAPLCCAAGGPLAAGVKLVGSAAIHAIEAIPDAVKAVGDVAKSGASATVTAVKTAALTPVNAVGSLLGFGGGQGFGATLIDEINAQEAAKFAAAHQAALAEQKLSCEKQGGTWKPFTTAAGDDFTCEFPAYDWKARGL